MGQASRRGTFEERKAQAIAKAEEYRKKSQELFLQKQAARDAILDQSHARAYGNGTATSPRPRVGLGGFGSRGGSMMMLAAILAATAGRNDYNGP